MRRLATPLASLAIALFLGLFLLWPLADTLFRAVIRHTPEGSEWTARYLLELFRNPVERDAVLLSLWLALWATLATFALALPLAWLFARKTFPGQRFFSALLLAPLVMPPFVGAVGMKNLFARDGPVNAWLAHLGIPPMDWFGAHPLAGIVILEALHLYPILYLNLLAAFANVDPALEAAAANLGAGPWRVFRRVTLPLALPGAFAGGVLVLAWAFTELGTPLIFNLRGVLPVRLFYNVSDALTNPIGSAQVTFVLVLTALGFLAAKAALRRAGDMAAAGRLSAGAAQKPLSRVGAALAWLAVGGVTLLAALPHLSVVVLSAAKQGPAGFSAGWTFDFYRQSLSSPLVRTALTNSLLLSLAACLVDLALGCGIAWLCVRKRARGAWLLDALAMLPLAAPGIVVAFGYLAAFGGGQAERWIAAAFAAAGWTDPSTAGRLAALVGAWFDPRQNPLPLLAVSYAIRRLPYMTRAAHAGLEQVSVVYEEAAANLGATPRRTWRRVTLPLIAANLLAGLVLTFIFSMLEVSDSLILAQDEATYPLTKAFYAFIGGLENGDSQAAALGVWTMALLGVGLAWAALLLGKRMGRLFRMG